MNTVPKLIAFRENGKTGYTNRDGKVILPAEYISEDSAKEVTSQYFTARKLESRSWTKEITGDESDQIKVVYCISSDGTQKTSLTDALYKADYYTEEISEIRDGYFQFLALDSNDSESLGIIKHDGKIIAEPRFTGIKPSSFGFEVTYTNFEEETDDYGDITDGNGLLDQFGDYIIPTKYQQLEQINDTWFIGKKSYYSTYDTMWKNEDYYTLIDSSCDIEDQEVRLNIEDYSPIEQNSKLIELVINNKIGIFNLDTRKFLIAPQFEEIDCSCKNNFVAFNDDQLIIFDLTGRESNRYAPLIFSYSTLSEKVFFTYSEKVVIKEQEVEIYLVFQSRLYQVVES